MSLKVNLIRQSGNPVEPKEMEAYENDWKKGFDGIVEEHGKFGPETAKALDALEKELGDKYNDLSVKPVDFPAKPKDWQELNKTYGNILVALTSEDDPDNGVNKGDVLLVINDMQF